MNGQRFGRLTVLSRHGGNKNSTWLCRCDCGNEVVVQRPNLRSSHVRSCGCLNRESLIKHGDHTTRLYAVWQQMRARCRQKRRGYEHVTVCTEWEDFAVFKAWALANGYEDRFDRPWRERLSIDRIDGWLGYYPANCRWTDWKTQGSNKRQAPDPFS